MSESDKALKQQKKTHEVRPDSRRRFLKGTAGAAPILLTVASRPVLGAQCTPSAWVSGNLSHPDSDKECGGRSPGFWRTKPDRWPLGYNPGTCTDASRKGTCKEWNSDGTAFHVGLSSSGVFAGTQYGTDTLMQVLWREGHSDMYELGAHLVAALFNAESISSYGMSPAEIIAMANQVLTTGTFTTSTGQILSAQDVVLFIQNTCSDIY